MDLAKIVKAAAVIQTACALSLVGIALYCNKKQLEIDATIAEGTQRILNDSERFKTTRSGLIVQQ